MSRQSTRNRQAYSLVELSTIVAILGVLAAIAAPRYANSLANYRAQAVAQRIAADINLARLQARISSTSQSIIFVTATNSYSLTGASTLRGMPTYTIKILGSDTKISGYGLNLSSEPYQATLVSAAFASSPMLTFDRFGQPSAGGTVSVQSGSVVKTITVDANTGLVSAQ